MSVMLILVSLTRLALAVPDAGCGLGSLIFTKNTNVSQAYAASINHSSSSQPVSITSGTSGCKTNGFVDRDREAQYFAEANFRELTTDLARGEGEALEGFATILGCEPMGLARGARSRMGRLLPREGGARELVHALREEMRSDPGDFGPCAPS